MFGQTFAHGYDAMLAPLERLFISNWRRELFGDLPEDAQLLEVGAGTGLNFKYYEGFRGAVASELSADMISVAKKRVPAGSFALVRTDAQYLPFASDAFDAALATLVFCSIVEPERAFAELRRVVRNGGRILLLEHVRPEGMLGRPFDLLNLLTAPLFGEHFNRRTAETAGRCGLKMLEVRKKAFGAVNLIVCQVEK